MPYAVTPPPIEPPLIQPPTPPEIQPPVVQPPVIQIADATLITYLQSEGYNVLDGDNATIAYLESEGYTVTKGSTPPPPPPPPVVSPATRLLSFFQGLAKKGNVGRVVSGHHAEIWSGDTETAIMSNITPLQAQTGKLPAILGLVMNFVSNSGAPDNATMQKVAQDWWAKGGIVHLSLYSGDPTSGAYVNPTGHQTTAALFTQVVTPGTPAFKQWAAQCAQYVTFLQALFAANPTKAIILRAFLEINGNWNWYGGQNLAQTILFQQQTHDYLMNGTGLADHVVIEYNNNISVGNYQSFPGVAYNGLCSTDPYDVDSKLVADMQSGGLYASLLATGVPIGLAECGQAPAGTSPAPNTVDLSGILAPLKGGSLNAVVYFIHWEGAMGMYHQLNAKTLLNDPLIMNLSDLPAL